MVAGLIGAISCIGHVTVLGRVSYYILPYSAKFYLLRQYTGNMRQCAAICRLLLHAIFCHILLGFCYILPTGQVECGKGWDSGNRWCVQGVTGWSHDNYQYIKPLCASSALSLFKLLAIIRNNIWSRGYHLPFSQQSFVSSIRIY